MRLLEPHHYGIIALAMVVIGFVGLFSELGLGAGLVQTDQIDATLVRTAASAIIAVNIVLASALAYMAPAIASWFGEPDLAPVIRILTLDLVVSGFAAVPFALLERELRFQSIAIAFFCATLLGSLTTITMAWLGFGVWALVGGTLATSLVRSVLVIIFLGRIVWPMLSLDFSPVRPLVRFSSYLLGSRFLWYWFGQADQLILGRLLSGSALGYYNVASQLAMLPMTKMMEAVNRVSFPILSRLQDDKRSLEAAYQRLLGILATYGIATCWGLASVANDFVTLVLGQKWEAAAAILAVLAFTAPLRALASFQNTVTTSIGAPEASTKELLLASLLIPGAVLVGALSHGAYGAALAWLLAYPLVFATSCFLTTRALGLPLLSAIKPLVRPAFCGALMIGTVVTARELTGESFGLAVRLLVEIGVGAVTYMICLRLFWRNGLRDSLTLVHELVRPGRRASS